MKPTVPIPASSAAFAAAPASPHVVARGLGLKRGDRWLFRGLDLNVPRGSFVAVVGPSGIGKSSFLACLAGLLAPTEGHLEIHDAAGRSHPPGDVPGATGVVFQNNLLVPTSSLLSNVLCGRLGRYPWWRTVFGLPRAERELAYRILCDLGLGEKVHRWVCETSGGEQQRTAIARALFQEPELYLADEPVSNLDTYLTGRVLGILRQEAARHGRTVFCVLHNPQLVDRFAELVLSFDPAGDGAWKLRKVASR